MRLLFLAALAGLFAAELGSANIGRGVPGHIASRQTDGDHNLVENRRDFSQTREQTHHKRAASPKATTQAEWAKINNTVDECTSYNLPAMSSLGKSYPTVWEVADILPDDTQALSIMKAINASGVIPSSDLPHGTAPGSYSGTGIQHGYDSNSDPDCYWTSTACTKPKHPGILPDITTCDEPHTYGYTFDDGPNCTHNALYDFWSQQNQKVSLMYIGSNVMDWPLQAQRGVADGHHICVHTWSHRYTTALTTNQVFAELYYTMQAIKDVMGVTPTCWRPPYGDVDDRVRAIAQGLGLRTYMWSGDTNDWALQPYGSAPTSSIEANYKSLQSIGSSPAAETGGIIVLAHELESPAMELTQKEYSSIKQAWKNVVPLSACLNITRPYPEEIVYPNFAEYVGGNEMPSGIPSTFSVSHAAVTPQGTLSGTGAGYMATASAGGPDNQGKGSTTGTAAATGADATKVSNHSALKSSASSVTMQAFSLAFVLAAALAGGFFALAF